MLEAKKLQEQTADELVAMYREISKEIFDLTNELRISRKIEKPHLLREKKKDRARVMTVLRQKSQSHFGV